jgi:hypothetical protein
VRCVKDYRRKIAHHGQRTEIDNQGVVAKASATLGEEDALVTGGANFLDWVGHIPGRNELAFLDVDSTAGFSGSDQQVGLAAEKASAAMAQ